MPGFRGGGGRVGLDRLNGPGERRPVRVSGAVRAGLGRGRGDQRGYPHGGVGEPDLPVAAWATLPVVGVRAGTPAAAPAAWGTPGPTGPGAVPAGSPRPAAAGGLPLRPSPAGGPRPAGGSAAPGSWGGGAAPAGTHVGVVAGLPPPP